MSPRKSTDGRSTGGEHSYGLEFALLAAQIPMEAFARMISGLGWPADQSRAICEALKKLKE